MDLSFLTMFLTFLLLGMFAITGDSKSLISAESEIDCSSSNMTVKQLKAAAHTISCPENDEQDFWVAACECVINELPKSQCPLCRISREAEQSTGSNESSPAVSDKDSNPRVSTRNSTQKTTTEIMDGNGRNERNMTTDSDQQSNRMKLHNTTTLSSSVNFIRFGK
ncbi:hypothetical protein Ocin01_06011 [Orchesella cincta]|uniref:Uncharacterized protein n=1 Tax=Orchesella cincta TaxID=48709 RepID=A0A1D2N5X2_ORCCI|nr:hypothetical protein Ocin01_06011 [Orchesella cincta]